MEGKEHSVYLRRYIYIFLGWTLVIGASLGANLYTFKQEVISLAAVVVRSNLDKDLVFREWASEHGGVYVPPTKHTPPNPYLKVLDRDVVTTSGKNLTLVNPAYLLRELQKDFSDKFGVKSHITSLKLLNPDNKPDEWEKNALLNFNKGTKEILEIKKINGKDYLRLMRPLIAEKSCLKCHGQQGYKEGDIRGGISSSVPLETFRNNVSIREKEAVSGYLIIWAVGSFGIFFLFSRNRKLLIARVEAEDSAMESELKFREMSEHSPLAIYLSSGIEQVAEYINPTFTKLFGYTIKDVPSMAQWWPLAHPDETYRKKISEEWNEKVKRAIENKSDIEPMEVFVTCKDRSVKYIRWGYLSTGTQNWAFGLDLTETKKAEEELRKSEKLLKDAQRLTHLGSWELDIVTNTLYWSDEFYRIYEMDREKFKATYEAFLEAVHPQDRQYVNSAYLGSVQNHTSYNIIHRLLMKDGRVKYIHEFGETYYDEDGKPLRSVGTGQDITERKLAEDKIRKLNEELETRVKERTSQLEIANKELETFSYSVSHDLRTPLRAIDGFSRILLEDYHDTLDEEGQRLLKVVRDNTNRMSNLIDDILQFSRSGRSSLNPSFVDLNMVVNDILKDLEPQLKENPVEIIKGPLPEVFCDREKIRQVLENLIVNALKFSSKNEKPVVKIDSKYKEDSVIVFIQDNGVGFDMKYADKLFGVFQRLHAVDEFEGTGIGLAIVKQIISKHGGEVWAESKLNEGATFFFSLPLNNNNLG